MRIMLTRRPPGAFGYITDAWINAFKSAGHSVLRYDNNINTWKQFCPDVYIGSYGHRQNIPNKLDRGNCKVVIQVNPYCDTVIKGISSTADDIRWVKSVQADSVIGYGYDADKKYWEYWESRFGVKWTPMPIAGDVTIHRRHCGLKEYDICYVGGYWKYKAVNIDKYLIPIFTCKNYKSQLYGYGKWPGNICKGKISDDGVNKLLTECIVGPCVCEPHTTVHRIDIPERLFKVILSGGIAVHDRIDGINDVIKSVISSTDEYDYARNIHEICVDMNDEDRKNLADKQYNDIISNHTYHHRVARLLSDIGFNNEAESMLDALAPLVQQ